MRIAYVGNFQPQHSTETHVAATLEDMGHTVTRIQEEKNGRLDVNQALGHDFLLWTRTWPGFVKKTDIEALRAANVCTVSYHLDLYVGISREKSIADDPFWQTDYVFTTDGDPHSLEVFERYGINHHWLPAGVYKKEAHKGSFHPRYQCDVAFVGNAYAYHSDWPYRWKLVEFLQQAYGQRFKLFGSKPGPTVRGEDLNNLYASAKVIVGDSLNMGFKHERYWSDRLYETTGRGGFLIFPMIKGLETQFDLQNELITYDYGNFGHLKRLIDYFLENEEQRKMFRDRAMARTIVAHTYHNRMAELLQVIEEG